MLAEIDLELTGGSFDSQEHGTITFRIFKVSFGFPIGEKLFYRGSGQGAWCVAECPRPADSRKRPMLRNSSWTG